MATGLSRIRFFLQGHFLGPVRLDAMIRDTKIRLKFPKPKHLAVGKVARDLGPGNGALGGGRRFLG
jgi:hypothetical protein